MALPIPTPPNATSEVRQLLSLLASELDTTNVGVNELQESLEFVLCNDHDDEKRGYDRDDPTVSSPLSSALMELVNKCRAINYNIRSMQGDLRV